MREKYGQSVTKKNIISQIICDTLIHNSAAIFDRNGSNETLRKKKTRTY